MTRGNQSKGERVNQDFLTCSLHVLEAAAKTPETAEYNQCPLYWFEKIDSTMTAARVLAADPEEFGPPDALLPVPLLAEGLLIKAVVISREQEAGKGRQGREWKSQSDAGVYMTLLFQGVGSTIESQIGSWPLCVGVAVRQALAEYGVDCLLKWPNDIVRPAANEGKLLKMGGILNVGFSAAGSARMVSTGIGVNVRKCDALESLNGVSIADLAAEPPEVADAAGRFIRCVTTAAREFSRDGFSVFHSRWNEASALAGREVDVACGEAVRSGVVKGVNDEGALLLADEAGEVRHIVYSGEVSRVYVAGN